MPSPFYNTGARYGVRALVGTTNVSDIDVGMQAMRDDVENKFTGYVSGTHAARLAATSIDGLLWRETDTGRLYLGIGAATWVQILETGQGLQLASTGTARFDAFGQAAFSGDGTSSIVVPVNHGITGTPINSIATPLGWQGYVVNTTAPDSTQLHFQTYATSSFGIGVTYYFYWRAVG